jgi:hypothetical protein
VEKYFVSRQAKKMVWLQQGGGCFVVVIFGKNIFLLILGFKQTVSYWDIC